VVRQWVVPCPADTLGHHIRAVPSHSQACLAASHQLRASVGRCHRTGERQEQGEEGRSAAGCDKMCFIARRLRWGNTARCHSSTEHCVDMNDADSLQLRLWRPCICVSHRCYTTETCLHPCTVRAARPWVSHVGLQNRTSIAPSTSLNYSQEKKVQLVIKAGEPRRRTPFLTHPTHESYYCLRALLLIAGTSRANTALSAQQHDRTRGTKNTNITRSQRSTTTRGGPLTRRLNHFIKQQKSTSQCEE